MVACMVKLRHWLPLLFCTSMLMSPENVSVGAALQPGGVGVPTRVFAMSVHCQIVHDVPTSHFNGNINTTFPPVETLTLIRARTKCKSNRQCRIFSNYSLARQAQQQAGGVCD